MIANLIVVRRLKGKKRKNQKKALKEKIQSIKRKRINENISVN